MRGFTFAALLSAIACVSCADSELNTQSDRRSGVVVLSAGGDDELRAALVELAEECGSTAAGYEIFLSTGALPIGECVKLAPVWLVRLSIPTPTAESRNSIAKLIELGVNPFQPALSKQTPIVEAALMENWGVVQYMLDNQKNFAGYEVICEIDRLIPGFLTQFELQRARDFCDSFFLNKDTGHR